MLFRSHINFRLLIELCRIFKENRSNLVTKKLIDYGTIKQSEPHIEQLINLAGNYADDFEDEEISKIEINSETKSALSKLITILELDNQPEDLQNTIYNIAKENNVQPKDFFMILYQIIINANRGPKIGPFIIDIGRKKVANIISKHI